MNIIKKTRDKEKKNNVLYFCCEDSFFSVAGSIIWHIKVIPIDSFATNRTHVYKSPRAFETNTTSWFTHYLIFSFNFRNIGFVSSSTNNTLCVRTHFIFVFRSSSFSWALMIELNVRPVHMWIYRSNCKYSSFFFHSLSLPVRIFWSDLNMCLLNFVRL